MDRNATSDLSHQLRNTKGETKMHDKQGANAHWIPIARATEAPVERHIYLALDFDGVLHSQSGCPDRLWTEKVAKGEWTVDKFFATVEGEYADDWQEFAERSDRTSQWWKPRMPFECSPVLETVLHCFPEVRLVIATAWRIGMSVQVLRTLMPPGLAKRVVGKLDDTKETFDGTAIPGIRSELMVRWMRQHAQPSDPWLALDDTQELWAGHEDKLVAPDSWKGLGPQDARELMIKVDAIRAATRQWSLAA